MKLKSNVIYRAYTYTTGTPLPSLEIKGTPKVFVSLDEDKPRSIDHMTEVTADLQPGVNLLNGQIRWIAASYDKSNDVEGQVADAVYECGIVTTATPRG